MAEVLVKIVIELLSILSIATKEMNRKRASELSQRNTLHTPPISSFSRTICPETIGADRY